MNATHFNGLDAAEFLQGVTLSNGWKVVQRIDNQAGTGGNFSVPYIVETKDGQSRRRAFLKALNWRQLAQADNFALAVERHMRAFNFEKSTLDFCRSHRLKRVATLLDAGEYKPTPNSLPVCYIIFELADGGDARKQVASLGRLELAWRLRTLHQVAVGLKQLHGEGIAHQDLKPSNILFFGAFGAKVADLGCADTQLEPNASPRGTLPYAGDPSYAPPELLYGEVSPDWRTRRLGCDLYLLGSLVVFFFTGGASMTALVVNRLQVNHRHHPWPHDYRTVLPYVRAAFEEAVEQVGSSVPASIRPSIVEVIHQLCEPDPRRRGHPADLGTNHFNLERYISTFNRLAVKAAFHLIEK